MKETRVIELQDLKLVLNLMKKLMDMKPEWNAGLMNLYARLYENYYHDEYVYKCNQARTLFQTLQLLVLHP